MGGESGKKKKVAKKTPKKTRVASSSESEANDEPAHVSEPEEGTISVTDA